MPLSNGMDSLGTGIYIYIYIVVLNVHVGILGTNQLAGFVYDALESPEHQKKIFENMRI